MDTEKRLNSLETTVAHQEAQITDLSAMIAAQWQEIDRLKRALTQAQDKLDELGDAPPAHARPPHY